MSFRKEALNFINEKTLNLKAMNFLPADSYTPRVKVSADSFTQYSSMYRLFVTWDFSD